MTTAENNEPVGSTEYPMSRALKASIDRERDEKIPKNTVSVQIKNWLRNPQPDADLELVLRSDEKMRTEAAFMSLFFFAMNDFDREQLVNKMDAIGFEVPEKYRQPQNGDR